MRNKWDITRGQEKDLIPVVILYVCITCLFFFITELYSWPVCTLFKHSLIIGHFGYFWFLAITYKTAMNITDSVLGGHDFISLG